METNSNNSAKKRFVQNILLMDIALVIVAGLGSLVLNFNFGIILLALGMLAAGIGTLLGSPDSTAANNPRNQFVKYLNRPVERAADEITYDAQHSIQGYAFENVMLFAGLMAILLGAPFILQIMFSK